MRATEMNDLVISASRLKMLGQFVGGLVFTALGVNMMFYPVRYGWWARLIGSSADRGEDGLQDLLASRELDAWAPHRAPKLRLQTVQPLPVGERDPANTALRQRALDGSRVRILDLGEGARVLLHGGDDAHGVGLGRADEADRPPPGPADHVTSGLDLASLVDDPALDVPDHTGDGIGRYAGQ